MGKETKIKVLHLETAVEWRGGQQQIAYLVHGLLKAGLETTLICRPESEIYRHFKQKGWPVLPVQIKHSADIKTARIIARFANENRFDLLHVHSSHALSLGILIKMMQPKLKLVASRRVDFSVRKPLIGTLKYNNKFIDRIICISENIARVLANDGVPPTKITVIHSGIDLDRFNCNSTTDLKEELRIPKDHLVVGTVAALVGHKDYPTLLQAAQKVIRRVPNVTFVAVGDGGDREKLRELHRSLELGNRFLFTGFRSDLQRFYNLFDVFVLASHKEGLGTSVLDALACGLPVVATKAGGIPEMITNEENGLLVPARNPQASASAIERLLKDWDLRKRLANNARASVQAFSFENMVQKHIALYRELVEGDVES